jgi:hypothetical protein
LAYQVTPAAGCHLGPISACGTNCPGTNRPNGMLLKLYSMLTRQGDQIGRIFAQWAIVYYGQFFENYRSSRHFCATFPLNKLIKY